ncbi:MAG: hypothetical protein KTV77_01710 [Wolbachia endosymbiont of Fragariocoptes setiger]|nr:hypothetical protein [Wolbachia endosymbiont of Fragariocoptes setiger]
MNKGDYKAVEQLGYLVENKKPIKELIDLVSNLEKKGEFIFEKRLDTINYVLNKKTIEKKET